VRHLSTDAVGSSLQPDHAALNIKASQDMSPNLTHGMSELMFKLLMPWLLNFAGFAS
jgi:hypothetical protein